MSYRSLFRESFGKLLHPALWLFGLLTALGASNVNWRVGQVPPLVDLPFGARALLQQTQVAQAVAAGLILGLVLLILSTFGQAALIGLINKSENGDRISVGDGIDMGGRRFLPLLAVRLLLTLPVLIVGVLATQSLLPLLSSLFDESPREVLLNFNQLGQLVGLSGLALILSLLTGGIAIGAERAVVIEGRSIFDSIGLGWRLMWSHLGDILVITVMFILALIVIGLIFACPLLPIVFANATFGSLGSSVPVLEIELSGSQAVLALLIGVIVGTLGSIFVTGVWTLAYRHWRSLIRPRVTPAA